MASRPELKVDDEVGFIKFFRGLPAKDDETIRLFDRGDFYTAHGEDAVFIAKTVYRSTSVLRQLGRSPPLDSVTLSVTVFRNFLREALFRLSKRIEIWESAGRMAWKVGKQASPGNLQDIEDQLGEAIGEAAPIILAVKISARANETRHVGVCFADASVRELGVSEFADSELYSNFESLLIQLGVRECLVQADTANKDVELAKIRAIADNCGCAVSVRPAADYSARDVEEDLARLLKDENASGRLPQTDLKLAMHSAAALIRYLGLMSDATNVGQYALYQHDLAQYMKLDAAALKALNLMPGPRDGSKTMSLFGLLNHCKTPMGPRLLAQWLKQPLMSLDAIQKRQQLVEAFMVDTELRQTVQEDHMRSIPDLYRLAKKFQRGKAGLEDVIRAYQASTRLPGLVGTFEGVMDEAYKDPLDAEYTTRLTECNNAFGKFQEMVESTVDLDALDNHEYIIKPDFDEKLQLIKARLDRARHAIAVEHRKVGKQLDVDTDKKLFLEQHRVHGWCLRLTRAEAAAIRNKGKDYQEITTQKNGVYFTTPALAAARREFDQLSENYNRTQSGLASEVVAVAGSYVPVVEKLAGILAHLDVIVSFAHVSAHAPIPYVRPTMHTRGSGSTELVEARHPCMEVQDDVSFIANDVSLARETSHFVIITGPNMGGKSTYIRQTGVIALLAQTGCFVPCASASLTIYDCILARVGASDSQLKGVSTFMAEMLETATILRSATRDSLIIIDELGRGTSTYDGFGLAWAIAEHIVREIGAAALFATHFHELTALADAWPQVANRHVVAHIDDSAASATPAGGASKVTLLYKVADGVCDQSFGIHVAELVRFPPKVVAMAKRKADELEDFEGKHEAGLEAVGSGEVARGNELLRDVLVQWRAATEGKGLGVKEQVDEMRRLVKGNAELMDSAFFKRVLAL